MAVWTLLWTTGWIDWKEIVSKGQEMLELVIPINVHRRGYLEERKCRAREVDVTAERRRGAEHYIADFTGDELMM
jgi:hypothetical protein